VLEVSLETTLTGLGMNSTLSEKPTRVRFRGLIGEASSELVGLSSPRRPCWWSCVEGEFGAEPPRGIGGVLEVVGFKIMRISCADTAAERRWACPRLPGFGGGRTLSPWVGLVLIRPEPFFPSPPINSLVPLRWPAPLEEFVKSKFARLGDTGGLAGDGVTGVVEGLNVKLGSSEGVESGRRPVAFGKVAGGEDGEPLAGKTKVGS
jgi:hypothetical protein